MSFFLYITAAILVILILVGIFLAFYAKKQKKKANVETDYKAFYVMGIAFLPMGIIFSAVVSPAFVSFIALGIIYMAIGLKNKDKWKKK